MLIVPLVLRYVYGAEGSYWFLMVTVGAGEIVCCGILGMLLYKSYKKSDNRLRGDKAMAVKLNENKEIVADIREDLKRTGGYCPCRLERTEDNKCMCKEFRDQIADPEFEGYCHCMLYYKSKD